MYLPCLFSLNLLDRYKYTRNNPITHILRSKIPPLRIPKLGSARPYFYNS
jgi:hypothetical protein